MNRIAKKVGFFVFLLLLIFITFADRAEAYIYTVSLPTGKYSVYYNWGGGVATGYNVTQGYAQNLSVSVGSSSASITIPDDGCTWQVSGFISGSRNTYNADLGIDSSEPVYVTFSTTVTTSGTFSGYSPKTATVAANVAATNAQNAYNGLTAPQLTPGTLITPPTPLSLPRILPLLIQFTTAIPPLTGPTRRPRAVRIPHRRQFRKCRG
ncbi:hypothetical protein Desku_2440 [Desulfofundulus kuznetsovii DSM 6115]|uniref:Uncharacterized protein n=1 Tax=Desulfofundulus kuznetsovii (strain DSM 6115 / VKM B-1805 / 17) TaxID=760568 RepID=A0AAU8PUW6_DESK7|nr:hypothetical protein Desku_2440 [Desulfofundulus kuznetsovii DSM 6115]